MAWMEQQLEDKQSFAQLNLPFAAIATDIVTGELVIMNEGAVAPAVRASCSVPGIFTPCRRDGRLLVDGGVIANLPVQVARHMGAEYVIAVDLLPAPGDQVVEPENIVDLSLTAIYSLIRANQGYGEQADCTIAPHINQYSFLDLAAAEELIAAGRTAAAAHLAEIHQDLGL
jgi:NTE family protein